MTSTRRLRYVEFVVWVVAVAAIVVVVAGGVGYAVGGDLVAAKHALFVAGFLMFGVGSLQVQPVPSYRDGKRLSIEGDRQNALEERIQEIPPLRDEYLPYDRRVGRGAKLFAASLVVLGVSLLMEVGFGVAV